MGLRYRCLLIDHDDTAVNSTAVIHYPAHLEALRVLRPAHAPPTMDEWLVHNFHGIMEYLVGELGLTAREQMTEFEIWRSFTTSRTPSFFPGFIECLADFRRAGGLVAVISHSEDDVIRAHYEAVASPRFIPDAIFGWAHEPEKRKPSPWPVKEALRLLGCGCAEALIVDDLKPGVLMSAASGVEIAAAGWGHRVPEIEEYMRAHAAAFFPTVEDMREFLIGGSA